MTEKSFDITDQVRSMDSDLADAAQETTSDPIDYDKAVPVFPVMFDKSDVDKDFRPEEVQESQFVPKDSSAPVSASDERLPTGLEDVSLEDQLNVDTSESEQMQPQPPSPPTPPQPVTTTG